MGKMVKRSRKKVVEKAEKEIQSKPEKVHKPKERDDGDPMYNEVDDFSRNREKISLNKGDMGYSEEDEDSDEQHENTVDPALHEESSSDDEDDDAEGMTPFYEDDEEAYQEKRERAIEQEGNITKQWGKKKKDYYGADVDEFELLQVDEDDAEEEEKEAISQQKALADDMDEEDMDIGEMLAVVAKEKETHSIKDRKKSEKKKKKNKGEKDLLSVLNTNLDSVVDDDDTVEKIEKSASKMTVKQKKDFLKKDAPELLLMLDEVQPMIEDIKLHIQPLLQKIKDQQLPTSKGLSFLELKYHLLLTYCTNICFYMLLKAQGKRVKDHPVIKQLATIRTILDKTKSIDQKLKYQVEKLLKLAALGPSQQSKDPLSFRPDPRSLVSKQDEDDDIQADQDQVYKPARLAAVEFTANEQETIREREKKEKARAKAQASSFVKEIKEEMFDKPEERGNIGDVRRDADDDEKQEYEEEYMIRLMETKQDRKKRKKQERISTMEDFDDFGDLSTMAESFMDKDLGGEMGVQKVSKVDQLLAKEKNKRKAPAEYDDSFDDFEGSSELYNETGKSSKKKKLDRSKAYPKPEWKVGKDKTDIDEGERRHAGNRILKNRGLTRPRPREKKNPRVAHRIKYTKALEKRRSQVSEYAGKSANYGGEATGIKSGLIKSTKLIDHGQ